MRVPGFVSNPGEAPTDQFPGLLETFEVPADGVSTLGVLHAELEVAPEMIVAHGAIRPRALAWGTVSRHYSKLAPLPS